MKQIENSSSLESLEQAYEALRQDYLRTKDQLEQEKIYRKATEKRLARDLQQAEEKIKRHLSYRLGREIVQSQLSPLAWATLPFRLIQAYRSFRADKTSNGSSAHSSLRTSDLPHHQQRPEAKLVPGRSNVLSILDEYSEACFMPELNIIRADPKSWKTQLDEFKIDFFLAESAWRGNDGSWSYAMTKFHGQFGHALLDLLAECQRRRIPTVFWNKEDPVNYEVFIDAARHFDFVFTTDRDLISRYEQDLGHSRVYFLPFAASTTLQTPILSEGRNGRVAFAGSWHGQKYPTRARRLETLFKYPLQSRLLDIYDRHSLNPNAGEGLRYPASYQPCVYPAVPYGDVAERVYKRYSVVLNVNSVESSSSMLARRIYELCACGTPIISSPADSIRGELAEIVQVAHTELEAEQLIRRLLNDDLYALRIAARGVRFAHSANTYTHRAAEISSIVLGADAHLKIPQKPCVSAICVSKRPQQAASVARMLRAQVGVELKVIYVAHNNSTNEDAIRREFADFEGFKFIQIPEEGTVLADGLNAALGAADTDIVAKIDDDDHYGPHYLLDSCLALKYSHAALVGKASFFCYVESTGDFAIRFPGKHYRFFKRVQGGTLVWRRSRTEGIQFRPVRQGTDSRFIEDVLASGQKVYSSDPFNFVHVRYRSDNNHTWAINDEDFLASAEVISKALDLDLAFT